VQIVRHYEHVERSYFNVETYAYRGPALYDGKGYRKLDVEDDEDKSYRGTITGGWVAALQHHFVAAAVPPVDASYDYELNVDAKNDFILSYRGPLVAVPAAGKQTFTEQLFVGPKLQDQLELTGPRLELVADYGMLTIISKPLFWLLNQVNSFVGNWGLAIILVTFLIKLAFYKLTAASGRSMAKMRNLSPRIKAIQERYKDDREQLGRQMMEIYKREKINPLAGCLPILIQIPVFLAFYWVLLESVEMRQAPFFGWITDLSSRDPYFILPVIMGAAMFLQFKLQPMPSTDPMQAKIFAFMPVIMAGTMVMFPSGLVLYWLTNTVLSIAQQWRINKLVATEEKKTAS
jgi:YidC/Oxa1 family membrane protein insertase